MSNSDHTLSVGGDVIAHLIPDLQARTLTIKPARYIEAGSALDIALTTVETMTRGCAANGIDVSKPEYIAAVRSALTNIIPASLVEPKGMFKCIEASTGHLTQAEKELLDRWAVETVRNGHARTVTHEYGYLLFLGTDPDSMQDDVDACEDLHGGLALSMRYAQKQRASLLNFDADAEALPGIPYPVEDE